LAAELYEKIWRTVSRVPPGAVATYGQIAREAGLGRRARRVGEALRHLPAGSDVPWHRVINARGEISLPAGSAAGETQRQRLESEGIVFRAGAGGSGSVRLAALAGRAAVGTAGALTGVGDARCRLLLGAGTRSTDHRAERVSQPASGAR
jgi:methylated-DNA-protein-cysteine methyltransferase-like protein